MINLEKRSSEKSISRAISRLPFSVITLLAAVISLTFTSAHASMGVKEGGGGDPLATEFLLVARQIADVLPPQSHTSGEMNQGEFRSMVDRISLSLRGLAPILTFPAGRTLECFKAVKLGCTSGGSIRIARDGWGGSTQSQKIELVAMEISLLLGKGASRYSFSSELANHVMQRGYSTVSMSNSGLNDSVSGSGYALLSSADGDAVLKAVEQAAVSYRKAYVCDHQYPDGQKMSGMRIVLEFGEDSKSEPPRQVYRSASAKGFLKVVQWYKSNQTITVLNADSKRKYVTGFTIYTYKWVESQTVNSGTLDSPRYTSTRAGMSLAYTDTCFDHY